MQSDLLGAHAIGLRNLLIFTGDPRKSGDYSDATLVFDVDSIGLTNAVSRLNRGCDVGGQAIGAPTAFHIGVIANPAAPNLDEEVRRFEYKAEAGAEFAVTPPVYDLEAFDALPAAHGTRAGARSSRRCARSTACCTPSTSPTRCRTSACRKRCSSACGAPTGAGRRGRRRQSPSRRRSHANCARARRGCRLAGPMAVRFRGARLAL